MNIRDKILAADDIKKECNVHIPEWDVTVDVWALSGEERARALQGAKNEDGEVDDALAGVTMVIEAVREVGTSTKIFTPADRDPLFRKSMKPVGRLARIALALSGMSSDSIEAIRGNSVATPSGGSTSASPKRSGAR